MRYDVCVALTRGLKFNEVAMKDLKEVLSKELERGNRVKNISNTNIVFTLPKEDGIEGLEDIETEYGAYSNKEQNSVVVYNKLKGGDIEFTSKEVVASKDNSDTSYSCLEIFNGEELVLINAITIAKDDQKITNLDMGCFVYDKKVLEIADIPSFGDLVNGNFESTDFYKELMKIKNELLSKEFIKPDYYAICSGSDESQGLLLEFDCDGEHKAKSTIPILDLKSSSKKIAKRISIVLLDEHSIPYYSEIEAFENEEVRYVPIFDCDEFLLYNLKPFIRLVNTKKGKLYTKKSLPDTQ